MYRFYVRIRRVLCTSKSSSAPIFFILLRLITVPLGWERVGVLAFTGSSASHHNRSDVIRLKNTKSKTRLVRSPSWFPALRTISC